MRQLTSFLAFASVAGLLVSHDVPALAWCVLSALGVGLAFRHGGLVRRDWMLLGILAALPLYVVFNMAVTDLSGQAFQRPARLLLVWAGFLHLRRVGLPWRTFASGVLAALLLGCLWAGYALIVIGSHRVEGAEGPIHFGNFGLLLGLLGLSIALHGGGVPRAARFDLVLRSGGFVAFVAGLWLSAVSGTRGGWLAAFLAVFMLRGANPRGVRQRGRRGRWALAMFSLGVIFVIALLPGVHERVAEARGELGAALDGSHLRLLSSSVGLRLHMWALGLEAFANHPLLGIGVGNLNAYLEAGVALGDINPALVHHRHLHNELITQLATGGVIGAFALLGTWAGLIAFFWPQRVGAGAAGCYARAGLIVVVATIVFSLTDSMFGTSTGINALVILLGVSAGGLRHAELNAREI